MCLIFCRISEHRNPNFNIYFNLTIVYGFGRKKGRILFYSNLVWHLNISTSGMWGFLLFSSWGAHKCQRATVFNRKVDPQLPESSQLSRLFCVECQHAWSLWSGLWGSVTGSLYGLWRSVWLCVAWEIREEDEPDNVLASVYHHPCFSRGELNSLKVAETDFRQVQSFCSVCNAILMVPTSSRNWVKGWSMQKGCPSKAACANWSTTGGGLLEIRRTVASSVAY